ASRACNTRARRAVSYIRPRFELFAQGNEKKEMNWPLFINLIELEVLLLAFAGIVIWTIRIFRRGVWR
ncbi:MAG: hypothetical protein ACLPV4_22915, partial [Solirubrobacteraceae bacterium]